MRLAKYGIINESYIESGLNKIAITLRIYNSNSIEELNNRYALMLMQYVYKAGLDLTKAHKNKSNSRKQEPDTAARATMAFKILFRMVEPTTDPAVILIQLYKICNSDLLYNAYRIRMKIKTGEHGVHIIAHNHVLHTTFEINITDFLRNRETKQLENNIAVLIYETYGVCRDGIDGLSIANDGSRYIKGIITNLYGENTVNGVAILGDTTPLEAHQSALIVTTYGLM